MSDSTLLAAVHAAVNGEGLEGEPDVKPVALTADMIKSHAPAIAAELVAEGAAAERTRIEGIRAAAFAGQDRLASDLIADGKTTPGEAALRFISAQKEKLASHAQAIQDNDKLVAAAKPAPIATEARAKSTASTPDGWKAEWASSDKLQAEFTSADLYAAHMKYETRKNGVAA